jgi:hypothetical protein
MPLHNPCLPGRNRPCHSCTDLYRFRSRGETSSGRSTYAQFWGQSLFLAFLAGWEQVREEPATEP